MVPLREFLVSYNLGRIFIFVVSGRIPIANNVIALTKLIARIWECGDIAKKEVRKEVKSDKKKHKQSDYKSFKQTHRCVSLFCIPPNKVIIRLNCSQWQY